MQVMKKLMLTGLVAIVALTSRAQLFGPESMSGAFWGSFIGGLAGGDKYCGYSGQGAAIGAGVGLIAGAIAGEMNRRNNYNSQPYVYTPAPRATIGYGYTSSSSPYVYCAPNSYCAPAYYYRAARPNYAVNGTLLGAASGALIGAGQNDAGKGAAIGAGAGLVLGTITELATQKRERKAAAQVQYVQATQPQTSRAESEGPRQPETQDQNQITSKPVENSTYYWTTPPQIADAPRVPDAPTF